MSGGRAALRAGEEIECALPGTGRVLFTTRAGGNLSTLAGDGHQQGGERRELLRRRLGLERLWAGPQEHGTRVHRVLAVEGSGAEPAALAADGHATALPGVGVMVLAADCMPVALASEGAVAMVHAGWRGLAGGVLEQGVLALAELGGAKGISAIIGPCAGPCCYEVGPEVHGALGLTPHRGNIDLRRLASERLLAAGAADVAFAGGCTICDEGLFSHRREGARAGRQCGVAWLS